MNDRSSRRALRPAFWRSTPSLTFLLVLLLFGAIVVGCGSSAATTTTSSGEAASTTGVPTTETATLSAADLGQAAGTAWAQAMQELNGLLAGQPEAASVSGKVAALKEQYVQKLVAYGRQREELDESGKAQMSAAVVSALSAAADQEWYKTYMNNYNAYASGDVGFVNLLASFNILTQYSDFDLLKAQAPKEAERLGIQ